MLSPKVLSLSGCTDTVVTPGTRCCHLQPRGRQHGAGRGQLLTDPCLLSKLCDLAFLNPGFPVFNVREIMTEAIS